MIRPTALLLLALVLVAGIAGCTGGGDDAADRSGDDTAEDGGSAARDGSEAEGAEAAADAARPPGPEGEPGAVATELGVDRTFTGEGSEAFCAEVDALQVATGGTQVDEAALADQMAAIEPPDEIADEWTNLTTVQRRSPLTRRARRSPL